MSMQCNMLLKLYSTPMCSVCDAVFCLCAWCWQWKWQKVVSWSGIQGWAASFSGEFSLVLRCCPIITSTNEVMFHLVFVCLFVGPCLSHRTQPTSRIFMKFLSAMYLWTSKIPLNSVSHPLLDHKGAKNENFNIAMLFIVCHCKWPHPFAAMACSSLELICCYCRWTGH